MTGFQYRL